MTAFSGLSLVLGTAALITLALVCVALWVVRGERGVEDAIESREVTRVVARVKRGRAATVPADGGAISVESRRHAAEAQRKAARS